MAIHTAVYGPEDAYDYTVPMSRFEHGNPETLRIRVEYAGAVLQTYERNGSDDSDFIAIVWDAESRAFRHIEYASTRGWSYANGAKVDATPDVIEAARDRMYELYRVALREDAARQSVKLEVGKRARVVAGRKVPHGTTWEVVDIRDNQYDRTNKRVTLVADAGERVYTYAANVAVSNPEDYMPSFAELDTRARQLADAAVARGDYRSVSYAVAAAYGVAL